MIESTEKTNLNPKENTVKILLINPDNSQPLYIGDKVEMEITVEYNTTRIPAQVGLNIQNGDISNKDYIASISENKDNVEQQSDKVLALLIATKTEVVHEKQGSIVIKQSFEVPDISSIQVFISLMFEGDQSTNILDTKFYKVASRD